MYIDNQWELIGTTTIDLSDYVTETELTTALIPYVQTSALTTTLDDRYVNTTGDTMSGTLTISFNNGYTGVRFKAPGSNTLTISDGDVLLRRGPAADGNTTPVLRVGGGERGQINATIRGLATPTSNTDATNKEYVDNAIASISIPTISATSALTTGITTGTVTINGTTTTFYAPESKDPVYYVEIAVGPDPENEGEFIASFVNGDTFESISERIENGENVKVRASDLILDLVGSHNDAINFSQLSVPYDNDSQFYEIDIIQNNHIDVHTSSLSSLTSELSQVAFTGDYGDLINKPKTSSVTVTPLITSGTEIGRITVNGNTTSFYFDNANWETEALSEPSYILNKPPIYLSKEYTVPSGQTYGDSNKKVVGAIIANRPENSAKGNYSWTEGFHTVGNRTINVDGTSITIPYGSSGHYSHTEGIDNSAKGWASHAEGSGNVAYGDNSHAEGQNTRAYGYYSHAEGANTVASGTDSHAEGSNTVASGMYSHAEGSNTISQRRSQYVAGEYNIADSTGSTTTRGDYVEIVGNGTADNTRSNARTLDWNGNEWLAGKLTVGATPTTNMDVATKQYVDNAVSGITPSAIYATSTLSEGTEIGSIDINGITTTFYAPEDTKVKQNDITGSTTVTGYFPVLFSDTTKETTNTIISEAQKTDKFYYNTNLGIFTVQGNGTNNNGGFYVKGDSHNYVTFIINKVGTTSTTGIGAAQLGNQYAVGTEDNSKGTLIIFGEGERGNQLNTLDNGTGNIPGLNKKQYINYLPMADQAVLAAGVTTGVGSSTVPVYMAAGGELLACTLPTPTTYTMSMTGPTINLLADGVAASTITLPIWDGTLD